MAPFKNASRVPYRLVKMRSASARFPCARAGSSDAYARRPRVALSVARAAFGVVVVVVVAVGVVLVLVLVLVLVAKEVCALAV